VPFSLFRTPAAPFSRFPEDASHLPTVLINLLELRPDSTVRSRTAAGATVFTGLIFALTVAVCAVHRPDVQNVPSIHSIMTAHHVDGSNHPLPLGFALSVAHAAAALRALRVLMLCIPTLITLALTVFDPVAFFFIFIAFKFTLSYSNVFERVFAFIVLPPYFSTSEKTDAFGFCTSFVCL